MKRYLILALTVLCSVTVGWGNEPNDSDRLLIDSLKRQVHELRLKEIVMQAALDSSGRTARMDSMRREQRRQHIDSLRQITPGVPLVVEGDTLFYLYASMGGEDAMHRVADISRRILQIGKSLRTTTDTLHCFEGEVSTDIMCGEIVIMHVSDLDGLWNGTTRQLLANDYCATIEKVIQDLQEQYGLDAKLEGLGWAVLIVFVQIFVFLLTVRIMRRLRREIGDGLRGHIHSVVINGYEVINVSQAKHVLVVLSHVVQVLLVIFQLFISLPLLFSIFPETEKFTWNMVNYVWSPLRDILISFVQYFPSLVKILVIIFVVRWLLKAIHHVATEIESEHLRLDGFYRDWAKPTYHIVRIFIIAFTLIVIWPLLPGSDSGIFKGVSIFVAALFSLGSTATVGNLISGLIITYMRPFVVGDFVRIGDREGTVIEKNTFVTRLRDIKENIITVPNNSILSLPTVNYSAAARERGGTIVHSDFTFTYHVPRATVESYLLEATARCKLLLKEPAPFVLVTTLEDFYTRYQINAYTANTHQLPDVYSEMHKNIIDVFHEHNLDPTSSHFVKVAPQNEKS